MKRDTIKHQYVQEAKKVFQKNTLQGFSRWKHTSYRFVAPADREYTYQWLWDTAFHAIVLSHFDTKRAQDEIRTFLVGQSSDGFIPHVIFWGERKMLPIWAYIESKIWFRPRTTAITQPPALALAVEQIYEKDQDKEFLKEVLPKLADHHRWLIAHRDIDGDGLMSIISPNESGMDELPVFQYVMGFHAQDMARLHYYYRKADLLNQLNGFNSRRILEKDYFNVEELVFNVVFIEAARSLSRLFSVLSNPTEALFFAQAAKKGEEALIEKCWNKEDKIFYSLFTKEEKHAKVMTVASLVPLFLSGLKGSKLKLLVQNHLLNPKEFWTKYPVPSVAASEPFYEPNDTPIHKMKLLWRGPTWISTNWFVVKGLRKHGYNDVADTIVKQMIDMIQKHGFREYYNPETGVGYRRKDFGWSTLIVDLL